MYQQLSGRLTLSEQMSIGIDKVEIGIPWNPKGEHAAQSKDLIKSRKNTFHRNMVRIRDQIIENMPHTIWHEKGAYGWQTHIHITSPNDGPAIATITLGSHWGKPLLNYQFNPSKLTEDGRHTLNLLFTLTQPFEYLSLYRDGVVKHLECFIDLNEVSHDDLALLDRGRRKTKHCDSTTYQGQRKGELVGTLYDKGRQIGHDAPLTRLEWRVQRPELTLEKFIEHGVANPLAAFMVVPNSALDEVAVGWPAYPELARSIRDSGLYGGIKNSNARKAITARLYDRTMPWWEPDILWEGFRLLIAHLRPAWVVPVTMSLHEPI